ncbi:uncharacterized protein Osi5 [Chironomus tepperi]|uniref:uncharacterized protein Osi5 n=1 Tax=Chironomus tepperi TaxID=113505 RepID=UPI00391F7C15
MGKYFLIFSITVLSLSIAQADLNSDCVKSENPILCRSANFLAKALNQVVTNQDDETLRLMPGLELVQNENLNKIYHENDERSMDEEKNDTFFVRIAKYLQTHDLKIKFSDIVGKTDLQEIVNNVFNSDDPAIIEARKKDKGGGMMLMSMLMMGKMMATMGLGGVGALAAKALGVSMMALMLAGIVGLKKLAEGGGDGGHSVHYVNAGGDHHRRRRFVTRQERSAPLPYRGYDIHE